MAVGSLPHKDIKQAMELVSDFAIPFWPQMVKVSPDEDMIVQFTGGMPAFDAPEEEFFAALETLFEDYETRNTDNYAIDAISFEPFLELIKQTRPKFAKGQIVGPFTLSAALTDKFGRSAIYDETLREVIVKTLALKALWQINKMKEACRETTPVIFIDEPSISQLGTSAFLTVPCGMVTGMIKEIADIIKENDALSAVHCCGKCDWQVLFDAGIDIINLDGFACAQNLALYHKETQDFLKRGGKIAWGIVPTLDREALEKTDLAQVMAIFEQDVKYLSEKGIDEKLIIDNSLITPSCGAGALTQDLAQKALRLTGELSKKLKEKYIDG